MKTQISSLAALLAVAALAGGCSNDDNHLQTDKKPSSEIKFSVAVPRSPRAVNQLADNITTTNTIKEFNTWTFVGGKPYMSDVVVTKADNGNWVSDPVQYWPVDEAVNFFSISPRINVPFGKTGDSQHIDGFTSYGKTDLLYAVNKGQTRAEGTVNVNFRHALAQLRFNIKREQSSVSGVDIKVDVSKVELVNINTVGSFNFPMETTSADNIQVKGNWTDVTTPASKTVTDAGFTVGSDEAVAIANPQYVFAIPQSVEEVQSDGQSYTGPYVRVLCKISHSGSNSVIWPSADTPNYVSPEQGAWLVFPLNKGDNFEWESGMAYRYTLTIGIPESSSQKIDFSVTVDEYGSFDEIPAEN